MRARLFALVVISSLASAAAIAIAQPPTMAPESEPRELTAADRTRRAKIVAKVGEARITVGDVEDTINTQQAFLRERYKNRARVREIVENMVRFELLAAEAERRGLNKSREVVQTRKQNAVQRMLRLDFEERITAESVRAADVRRYYDTHEEEFHRPAMMRASHILVATREEAVRLIATLSTQDARAFRESALQNSLDTETKLRGGDLRYFTENGRPSGTSDPPVDESIARAAFAITEVGGVHPTPVPVGERFSVVKLTGRRPAEHRTFAESEPGIRMRLHREARQNGIEELLDRLRQRYRPEIHEEAMTPIHLEPPSPAREGEGADEAVEEGVAPRPSNAPGKGV